MRRRGHGCGTCRHSGCCETPCGGRYWEPDEDNEVEDDNGPMDNYDYQEMLEARYGEYEYPY